MASGLRITNNTGELTLSSDGILYSYIGTATLGSVVQPVANPTTQFMGYSTYTIAWDGDIVVAVPVNTAGTSYLISLTQAGSTWTIKAHNGTGSVDANGFEVEASTTIYCFGRPTTVSGFGLALYDAAGNLSGDLSRQPLLIKQLVAIGSGATSVAMPSGMTTPAMIGWPFDEKDTTSGSGLSITNTFNLRGWRWDTGAGLLRRDLFIHSRELFTDRATSVHDTVGALSAVLVEASLLA